MKEIAAEYPLELLFSNHPVALYRFNNLKKPFNPLEIKQKPLSGYTEVSFQLPQKNISALKIKTLNSQNLAFRAFPNHTTGYYYVQIKNNKLYLTKISSIYLFEAVHQYYPVETHKLRLKKAESREELEHRKKSINYKLKLIEQEEFKKLDFDSGYTTDSTIPESMNSNNQIDESRINDNGENKQTISNQTVNFKKLEEIIKNARIVNFKDLYDIFKNKDAIIGILYKMTVYVHGRFILKTSYYEKRLWDIRNTLISMFKRNGEVKISETRFLGDEQWIAEEISNIVDKKYILKGFKESIAFDPELFQEDIKNQIKRLLRIEGMQQSRIIGEKLSIDEEIVSNILKQSDFLHLINNCYVINDDHWFVCVLKLFESRKSVELNEIEDLIRTKGFSKSSEEIVNELKQYCTHRITKYTIRNIKD